MLVRHRSTFPTTFPATFPAVDRSFDRAFEQLTRSYFDTRRPTGPIVNGAWRGDDEYVLTVDLPGVPAEAVNVEVTGDRLAIQVTGDTLDWARTLTLGNRLDADKVSAHHVDGRLTVRIGAVDAPAARSISIETSAPELAIEANSTDADEASGEASDDQSTETNDSE